MVAFLLLGLLVILPGIAANKTTPPEARFIFSTMQLFDILKVGFPPT
jgi:predicted secreted Zn-dependent protease